MSKVWKHLPLLTIGLGLCLMIGLWSSCGRRDDPKPPNHGRFVGQVKASWLVGGREMQLLENFGYEDPHGKLWVAPAESIVDGASIPQAFWTFIGGPFEGKYRDASVVHDVECDLKREPWQAVHRMFYEGCLCGGVESWQAKVMYAAVYNFGPRWEVRPVMETINTPDGEKTIQRTVAVTIAPPEPPSADVVQALVDYVKSHDPSLGELERLDFSGLPVAPIR